MRTDFGRAVASRAILIALLALGCARTEKTKTSAAEPEVKTAALRVSPGVATARKTIAMDFSELGDDAPAELGLEIAMARQSETLRRLDWRIDPAGTGAALALPFSLAELGPAPEFRARRAFDFIARELGGVHKVKAAALYIDAEFAHRAMDGFEAQAELFELSLVAMEAVPPNQRALLKTLQSLRHSRANAVLIVAPPKQVVRVLVTFAGLGIIPRKYPLFVGLTEGWSDDVLEDAHLLPDHTFHRFHLVAGTPTWGQSADLLKRFRAHSGPDAVPGVDGMMAYIRARTAVELVSRALEAGDLSRQGIDAVLEKNSTLRIHGLDVELDADRRGRGQSQILRPNPDSLELEPAAPFASPQGG